MWRTCDGLGKPTCDTYHFKQPLNMEIFKSPEVKNRDHNVQLFADLRRFRLIFETLHTKRTLLRDVCEGTKPISQKFINPSF